MTSPITNICIVSRKQECPPTYTILEKTVNGEDGDLWKDKIFRSKVVRYICFTTEISSNLDDILTDIALVGLKESPPPGYVAIRSTTDTQEQALYKHTLCLRYEPRSVATSGITSLMLCKGDNHREEMFTLAGEMNGIKFAFKMTSLTPTTKPRRTAPEPPSTGQLTSFASSTHNQPTTSIITTKIVSSLEGIPFKLNEKLTFSSRSSNIPISVQEIICKSLTDLLASNTYDFSKEKSLIYS